MSCGSACTKSSIKFAKLCSLTMEWCPVITITFFLMSTLTCQVDSAKILFLYPIATRSETNIFQPLAQTLASRGHAVTVVTCVNSSNSGSASSIRQIVPTTPLLYSDITNVSALEVRAAQLESNPFLAILTESEFTCLYDRCNKVLQHPEFQQLVRNTRPGSFDLIVISAWMQNCLYGIIQRAQAPFILISSTPAQPWIVSSATGFYPPPSFVPTLFIDSEDSMSFWDRLTNLGFSFIYTKIFSYAYTNLDAVTGPFFEVDIPPPQEIERKANMIFSHAHFALTFPRPMLPDMIEIGGIHCRPPKPLPKDLESFMSGPEAKKHGVIFFSLGSVVQAHELSVETMQIFLRVFSQFKQQVLWKFETEKMDNLPSNVRLIKWAPQQDILGNRTIFFLRSVSFMIKLYKYVSSLCIAQ